MGLCVCHLLISTVQQFADESVGDVMSHETVKVPQCCPHAVKWMESSPLCHLPTLIVIDTIAHLSQEVVQCAPTVAFSIGP